MKVVLNIRKSERKEAERIDQAVFGPMNPEEKAGRHRREAFRLTPQP